MYCNVHWRMLVKNIERQPKYWGKGGNNWREAFLKYGGTCPGCFQVYVYGNVKLLNFSASHTTDTSVLFVSKKGGGRVCEFMHTRAIYKILTQGRIVQKSAMGRTPTPGKSYPLTYKLCYADKRNSWSYINSSLYKFKSAKDMMFGRPMLMCLVSFTGSGRSFH